MGSGKGFRPIVKLMAVTLGTLGVGQEIGGQGWR